MANAHKIDFGQWKALVQAFDYQKEKNFGGVCDDESVSHYHLRPKGGPKEHTPQILISKAQEACMHSILPHQQYRADHDIASHMGLEHPGRTPFSIVKGCFVVDEPRL